jgi:phage shock protein PspC (stress-responsive transcriptional regulator)
MSEINRRETDAQVLRLFFITTAAFVAIGAVVYFAL